MIARRVCPSDTGTTSPTGFGTPAEAELDTEPGVVRRIFTTPL